MKRRILLTALLLLLTGCQQTPEQARKELAELGVEFTVPVFHASAENGDIVVVELFLTAGMNPDITDEDGVAPLMRAVYKNNLSIVRVLLDSGADADPRRVDNMTSLDFAAQLGYTEMVRLLVAAGAKEISPSILSRANLMGYTEIVELFGAHPELYVTANEASAIGSVRNIVTSQISYFVLIGEQKNYALDLKALEKPGLIDSVLGSGAKDGYAFSISGDADTFTVNASPLTYGSTGSRSFFSDESGVIRYTTEDRPATVKDPASALQDPPLEQ